MSFGVGIGVFNETPGTLMPLFNRSSPPATSQVISVLVVEITRFQAGDGLRVIGV
jgi:hypothetical protein